MATKTFEINGLGSVTITKRRSNRHLRLSIGSNGEIKVSIPTWAPYNAGLDFVRSKQGWIEKKRPKQNILSHNQPIGRAHRLNFVVADVDKPRTRINGNMISVSYGKQMTYNDPEVQAAAYSASTKALRQQAESLLPKRLNTLSELHDLTFKDIRIKQLTRRWGSCDQDKRIVLNLYLIQLPWELIDYVILHELSHTKHLNHGPAFWSTLESMAPNARQLKKEIGSYHPGII